MIDAVIGFFLLFGFYILNTINPDILSSSPKLELLQPASNLQLVNNLQLANQSATTCI